MGDVLGRRPKTMIGEPGNLPSRRSSGDREKFSAGGKARHVSGSSPLKRHRLWPGCLRETDVSWARHRFKTVPILTGGRAQEG